MGPPRHLIYLALLEASIARYESNPVLLADFKKLFADASSRLDAIRELVKAVGSEAIPLDVMKHFVSFANYKAARDKTNTVLRISPVHQRIMEPKLTAVNLHGSHANEIFDICLYACAEERQHGPAPAGSLERIFGR